MSLCDIFFVAGRELNVGPKLCVLQYDSAWGRPVIGRDLRSGTNFLWHQSALTGLPM